LIVVAAELLPRSGVILLESAGTSLVSAPSAPEHSIQSHFRQTPFPGTFFRLLRISPRTLKAIPKGMHHRHPSREDNMKTTGKGFTALVVFSALLLATFAVAATTTRYIHVRVSSSGTHELVRVNLPLTLAEHVIPAINHGQLRDGKVRIGHLDANNVNVRAILEALKAAPEGEFVNVQDVGNDVRVAKEQGLMVVHVVDKENKQNVDVTIPWDVAQALISETSENQLNIEAAVKALENVGDMNLVKVTGQDQNVRVWVDSRSSGE
jgi:ribonuclease HI